MMKRHTNKVINTGARWETAQKQPNILILHKQWESATSKSNQKHKHLPSTFSKFHRNEIFEKIQAEQCNFNLCQAHNSTLYLNL